jgi:hypothetical protein
MSLTDYKQRVIESHAEALARGEHDDLCEWHPDGFWVCNCSKRARERAGKTTPPGELIHQMSICPGCDEEVDHDGDGFTCPRCKCDWDERGDAHFYDNYGDVSADRAEWDAARAAKSVGADT